MIEEAKVLEFKEVFDEFIRTFGIEYATQILQDTLEQDMVKHLKMMQEAGKND